MECVERYKNYGMPFQILLIAAFVYRLLLQQNDVPLIIKSISALGSIIFGYCLLRLYRSGGRDKLITTGLFKYTRHPMYTGLALMDLQTWFAAQHNLNFWVSALTLYGALATASYFQEQETMARFGIEAKNYYTRTPRCFLAYPFKRIQPRTN